MCLIRPARALAAAIALMAAAQAPAQPSTPPAPAQSIVVLANKDVSNWFRAESEHFVVYTDAREEDVALLLDNLEKLDHLLRGYTRPVGPAATAQPKLTLYYLARAEDLRAVDAAAPPNAVGLYSRCLAVPQGYAVHLERIGSLADEQLDRHRLNETLSYAFEAYARHFLARNTDIRSPAWFVDGFAKYFSSVRFSGKQMIVGRMPQGIGEYLAYIDDQRIGKLEWADVLQGYDDQLRRASRDALRLEFEARAWALTHYLLATDDRRKALSRYLALVGRGLSPTVAFERSVGVKLGELPRVMWRYRLAGSQVLRVEHPSLPTARVSMRTMPAASGEFVLLDAALKSCPGREAGEALLAQATALAARHPNNALGRLATSRAQIDWGDPAQALPPLQALLQADEGNAEARVLLGRAHLRLAERAAGAVRRAHLDHARLELQRVLALEPGAPEAAVTALRADLATRDEPAAAVLSGVVSAWQAAREVGGLARAAALASAYAGNADQAIDVLDLLAQDVREQPQALWARQWQERLHAGITRDEILAEMRRDLETGAASKQWTLDREGVLRDVTHKVGQEQAAKLGYRLGSPAVGGMAGAGGQGGASRR